jgi:hypothetical protein
MNGKDYQTNGIGFPSCMPHTTQVGDSSPSQFRAASHYQVFSGAIIRTGLGVPSGAQGKGALSVYLSKEQSQKTASAKVLGEARKRGESGVGGR